MKETIGPLLGEMPDSEFVKSLKDKILSYCSIMVHSLESKTFTLPMSYTTFAEYLCVDRSAMMRELKKLNDKGILSVNKKQITVLSSEYI